MNCLVSVMRLVFFVGLKVVKDFPPVVVILVFVDVVTVAFEVFLAVVDLVAAVVRIVVVRVGNFAAVVKDIITFVIDKVGVDFVCVDWNVETLVVKDFCVVIFRVVPSILLFVNLCVL